MISPERFIVSAIVTALVAYNSQKPVPVLVEDKNCCRAAMHAPLQSPNSCDQAKMSLYGMNCSIDPTLPGISSK